ncbi:MAG: hypothetical protein AAGA03_18940, partial [Planctomycetota bacterium]
ELAGKLQVPLHHVLLWRFDHAQIPPHVMPSLTAELAERRQDWQSAEEHCRRVAELASDLAWPLELLGYISMRRGELDVAARHFEAALKKSIFSDQSIRLGTHWATHKDAKFSAAMLSRMERRPEDQEYWECLRIEDTSQRRQEVAKLWARRGDQADQAGRHAQAYQHS